MSCLKTAGRTKKNHQLVPQKKSRAELADVFRLYGKAYRCAHRLSSSQLKVMKAIEVCRTQALGGHIEQCNSCGFTRNSYNSCRNRHCPKCQNLNKAKWLEARQAELLDVPYFHTVFTLPHELNLVALCNKKVLYDLLFQSVSQTLLEFAANPKGPLGGKLGFTAILHTWDQRLHYHLHLHCAIPAGALALDNKQWIPPKGNYLFPVKALSIVYRAKFLAALKISFSSGKLQFPAMITPLSAQEAFQQWINVLYQKTWVVYSKPAFGGAKAVLDYLGRYTHKIAISNDRILALKDNSVRFLYRNRSQGNKQCVLTLPAEEFIRRFLLHTLPDSYMRVRHFGFLANRSKKQDLALCRKLLGQTLPSQELKVPEEKPPLELLKDLTGTDLTKCPACQHGRMFVVQELPRALYPSILCSNTPAWDSS
ncbi:MAG: IS91 family transposase [Nitrospira sp.]|nr:IS91 family transposase [Nitrospira sp.]